MYTVDVGGPGATTDPRLGVRGPARPRRGFGGNAHEAKNRVVLAHGFSAHCIVVPVLELAVLGV